MKYSRITVLVFALLLCTTIARAQQYQQQNDIPYTQSANAYAQERCKLDVYYSKELNEAPPCHSR